jgi:hypothetical protein
MYCQIYTGVRTPKLLDKFCRMVRAFVAKTKGDEVASKASDQELMEIMMSRYEEELSHPVQSLLGGELARALLIQVFRPPSFLSFFSWSSHMKYNNTCNCFRVLILKWIFVPVIPRSRKVCVFSFENLSDYDGAGLAIWEQQFG